MSFGFSAGDFVTIGLLIKDIIRSLKDSGGALSEYQELDRELHGLQRALDVVEHFQCLPEQAPMVNGLKVAALNCQFVLDNFATKLKKYEASLEVGRSRGRLLDGATKLKWSLMMKTDVQELRAYLSAHTSSLIMRLTIAGASMSALQNKDLQDSQSRIEHNLESAQVTLNSVNDGLGTQGSLLKGTSWMLWKLINKITGDVIPQLKAILFMANKAWTSNMEILDRLVKMQATSPNVDLRFTWAQSPVKFEDALGRVMPIPSEYNWEKVEAVIMAQFSTGPGHEKVFAGEYELYDSVSGTSLSRDEYTDSAFFPGMTITMAIIVGQYAELERCPRPDCRSLEFVAAPMGSRACMICHASFRSSQKSLHLPHRPHGSIYLGRNDPVAAGRCNTAVENDDIVQITSISLMKLRNERRRFKNISICVTELPITPVLHRVRIPKGRTSPAKPLVSDCVLLNSDFIISPLTLNRQGRPRSPPPTRQWFDNYRHSDGMLLPNPSKRPYVALSIKAARNSDMTPGSNRYQPQPLMSASNFTQQSQLDCQRRYREHQRQREESLERRRRHLSTESLDHGRHTHVYQRRREDGHVERRRYLFMEFYGHNPIQLENWQRYEFSRLSSLMKARIIDRRIELEWGLTPYQVEWLAERLSRPPTVVDTVA